ncbi:MAG: FecR domain-containing protein [Phycisphaerales bacterium JB063]
MSREPSVMIDAYLDGTLSAQEAEALNAWVKQSDDNARTFARAAWLHRQVYDRLQVQDLRQINDAAGDAGEVDYGDVLQQLLVMEQGADVEGVDLTEEMKRRQLIERREKARRRAVRAAQGDADRTFVIPKSLAYGVAAAVVFGLIFAGYAGWLGGQKSVTPELVESAPSPDRSVQPIVAHLLSGSGVRWGDASRSTLPGTSLRKGMLVLESGVAEVRFESGAVATFRGPATIDLRGDNRMALMEGAMVASVPKHAYGFTVDTPTMRVVDLGTEFGITANAAGDSAVQVFVGEVTAAAFDASGELGVADALKANTGLAIDMQTREKRFVAVDGRPFEDLAPHIGLLYGNLVVNGDFEQGGAAAVRGQGLADADNLQVPGWEDSGPGTVLSYIGAARHNYPNPDTDPVPESRGRSYYAGMSQGSIRQEIDVRSLASLADQGLLRYDYSAWLGGFSDHEEYLEATLTFLDASGHALGSVTLEPVLSRHRENRSGFVLRERAGALPAGTRRLRLELANVGSQSPPYVCDGYADNVTVLISADPDAVPTLR